MSPRVALGPAARCGMIVALSLWALGGCQPRELGWEFQLDPSLDVPARTLQAHLIPGACIDGPNPDRPRESVTYRFARGEAPPVAIRSLPPGTWAFEIEALDASCRPIGRGCQELELPTEDASVHIVVAPIPTEPSVCQGACTDGPCVDDGQGQDDGSARDADAREDAGTTGDAGPGGGRAGDAGPGDAGNDGTGVTDAGA